MARIMITLGLAALASVFARPAAAAQEVRGLLLAPIHGRAVGVGVEACPGIVDATLKSSVRQSVVHRFAVSPETRGKRFVLTADQPAASVDIAFGSARRDVEFLSIRRGGERGVVPRSAQEAVVCLTFGPPTYFRYRAG